MRTAKDAPRIGSAMLIRQPSATEIKDASNRARLYFCFSNRGPGVEPNGHEGYGYPAGFFIADGAKAALAAYADSLADSGWRSAPGEILTARCVMGGGPERGLTFTRDPVSVDDGDSRFWKP